MQFMVFQMSLGFVRVLSSLFFMKANLFWVLSFQDFFMDDLWLCV